MSERFGKYEVIEKIGEGGFGLVYRGFDPSIRRDVAIKTCISSDEDLRRRFAREAEIAGNLQHRNITVVYDLGEQDGVPYLVQEYLSGEDLDRKIRRREPLTFATRLLYLIQIARGLAYAHQQGIVHRDIKPANVRILDEGIVKIMDFGIARVLSSETSLTVAGNTLGTAAYLAPEQVRGSEVDYRCDIYSFGVLAYELLSYERAFSGERPSEVLTKVLNEEPRPLSEVTEDLPPKLLEIIERCYRKDPAQRFSDFGKVLAALDRLLRQDPKAPAPSAATPRSLPSPESSPSPSTPSGRRSRAVGDPPMKPEATALGGDSGPTRRLESWEHRAIGATPSGPVTDPETEDGAPWWIYALFLLLTIGAGAGAFLLFGRQTPPEAPQATSAEPESRPTNPSLPPEEPTNVVPVPQATLILAPAHPATTLTVNGERLDSPAPARLTLEAGREHEVVFALRLDRYSARRNVRLTLSEGEIRTLDDLLPRPSRLTVRADLGSPQVNVWLGGRYLGETPVDDIVLSAGTVQLGVAADTTAGATHVHDVAIAAGERLVLTFTSASEPPLSNRSR
ncbi:MAG: protein kinase [Acidobacteriota bacterium]